MTFRKRTERFWQWWLANSDRILDAIDRGDFNEIQEDVIAQVNDLHTGFAWVFGPPPEGKEGHSLTLSSEGDPFARLLVDACVEADPELEKWTFYPARQPNPDFAGTELRVGESTTRAEDIRVHPQPNEEAEVVDVLFSSEVFDRLARNQSMQVLFLLLDEALGEDGVGNWLGAIDLVASAEVPEGLSTLPLSEFPEYLDQVYAEKKWSKETEVGMLYELQPPIGEFPRGDVFLGTTVCEQLLNGYLGAGGPFEDPLSGSGAELVFLRIRGEGGGPQAEMERRQEVARHVDAALGEGGARSLGAASGTSHVYLDYLLLDGEASRMAIAEGCSKAGVADGDYEILPFTVAPK